ncbi:MULTISPECIES: threonine-phosphate decarboxylase CobD [unclassified Pseudomonas]|uniref:threonine-phosphate decarboxylase CobD n=1 Tax=unclassified Pseudomonas TaxID=196821 RepID=UPI000BC80BCB|nr:MULTISPECIES: threonine-phosphate decarboxylase CobD [unclassified Pseudomonas]PVZ13946.1 L-threonine O-3-phosphate decarboxylase [Pseudomonas sp. URIL14HWK12:I12]PVZ24252.1 L-threonine O-3-phosphate decarboxylase [Pseudomonas sp. URIL14HWK12:I10]PVZ33109.1 L-threonine O-3-phosphate decarboxylase [Pseudomonas sp. URIL14HWK12:I11]SNZ10436.1 L-threonine O-3-phosphate decarboxylase [Pseudomonas sp. URIL14HWK12:I9]
MLEHGGKLKAAAERFGVPLDQWLDLSTGLAPWPFEVPEIPIKAWARLPETDDGLEAAACQYYNASQVLAVPGSQAAIQALPRLRRPGKVAVLSPCYAEHAEAWRRGGHVVREIADAEVDYYLDSVDVLVVVNPNNPTGRMLCASQLLQWHARLSQRGGWLVVDEAFMDTTPELSLAPYAQRPGLVVLRSFGKFFGLAGVRLGFVLGEGRLLRLLADQIGPWAVPGPTREVGRACLQDVPAHRAQVKRSLAASQRLAALLAAHGYAPQGGCALFQWFSTAHALALHEHMGARGILLRLFVHNSSLRLGLPPDDAGFQRLANALEAFSACQP